MIIGIAGGVSIPNIFFRLWYRSVPFQIGLIAAFSVVLFFCGYIIVKKFQNQTISKKRNISKIFTLFIVFLIIFIFKYPIALDVPNPAAEHRLSIQVADKNNNQANSLKIEIIELKIDDSKVNLDSLLGGGKGKITEKGYLEITSTNEFSFVFPARQNSTFTILFNGNENSGKVLCSLDNRVYSEIDLYQSEPTERVLNLHSPIPVLYQFLSIAQNILGFIFGGFLLFVFSFAINISISIISNSRIGKLITIKLKNDWVIRTRTLLSIPGNLFAVFLLVVLCAIQIRAAVSYELFAPATNIEEAAYTYTSANNYIKFGLMNSVLLQDFSYSLYPEGHPYVYTHMPPGPDLFFTLLLCVFKENYQIVRVAVAILALMGLYFFYYFVKIILRGIGIKTDLAGYAVAMIGPWTIIRLFESQIYPLFPFLAFFPLLAWEKYRTTDKKVWLFLFAFISFLSALYIEYSLLSAVLFCYISLHLTQIIQFSKRDIAIYACSVLSGIVLHLVQNFAFYGPAKFFQELIFLLGNRITGYPSQQQLFDFYHQIGVVHHGSHPIDFNLLLTQILGSLHFITISEYANNMIFIILVITIIIAYLARILKDSDNKHFKLRIFPLPDYVLQILKITLWMVITLLIPILLFPAFAQEVNIATFGGNFFFAIFEISVIGLFCKQVYQTVTNSDLNTSESEITNEAQHKTDIQTEGMWNYSRIKKVIINVGNKRISSSLLLGILCLILVGLNIVFICRLLVEQYDYTIRKTEFVYQFFSKSDSKLNLDASLKEIKKYNGQLFMTNINIPTVGFLVQYPGYGVCDPESISDSGEVNISKCGTDFIKSTDTKTLSQKPRYFFYFTYPSLFPGFASCMPSSTMIGARGGNDCMKLLFKRLSDNYQQVYTNEIVSVFDLHGKIEKKD